MEQKPRTLADVDPDERGIPYAAWKARELNTLFEEHGRMKTTARIPPWVIEHSLKKCANRAASS